MSTDDSVTRVKMAAAADLSRELLVQLATGPDADVRAEIARRNDLPAEILDGLCADHASCVRQAVAGRGDASIATIARLAADDDPMVRRDVAMRRALPRDVHGQLLNDPVRDVRSAAAEHLFEDPDAPAWMLVSLAEAARGARSCCAWNGDRGLWDYPNNATIFPTRCDELRARLGDGVLALRADQGRVVCDAMLDAGDLEDRYADYPVADFSSSVWRHEVSTDATNWGYWDWLVENLRRVADDILGSTPDGRRMFLAVCESAAEQDPAPGM